MEHAMSGNFTAGEFIILAPMALAGAFALGMLPVASRFTANVLRLLGALLGVVFAIVLVEGLPLFA
jgi:hypothetical protein